MCSKLRETETLELKKSTSQLEAAVVSIVAMLNKHQRGLVIFGISPDGSTTGETVSEETMRKVSQKISKIEPKIFPTIEMILIEENKCIRVEFEGNETPYSVNGKFYMRVADEDLKLTSKEVRNIVLSQYKGDMWWDNEFSGNTIEMVNENAVRDFMKHARSAGRIDFDFEDVPTTLEKLELMKDGRLLKAAEVLFCDRNDFELQLAIFAGTDKNNFLDIKLEKGNLFNLLNIAELYVKKNIRWRVRFGGLKREEIPEVPINSLREALVNSLCHRDFREPKGNEIAIFTDRVEIYNPGDFPEGLTPEDFFTGKERSVLRNKLIAEAFYRTKDIEKWGSGLKRIHDECKREGIRVEFDVLKTGFLTTFYRLGWETVDYSIAGTRVVTTQETTRETMKKTTGETKEVTTQETRKEILKHIRERPAITMKELAEKTGLTIHGIDWNMRKLKEEGMIVHVGSSKVGLWKISVEIEETTRETMNKTTGETRNKIITLMKKNPNITTDELASNTGQTFNVIEYYIRKLNEEGKIRRVGSKKTGRWEVVEQ